MCSQQVVDFVREELAKGHSPTEVASELLNKCLASDPRETRGIGCDNMTCCIVLFQDGLMTAGASGDADMGA